MLGTKSSNKTEGLINRVPWALQFFCFLVHMAQSDFTLLAVQCNRSDAMLETYDSEVYDTLKMDTSTEQRAKTHTLMGAGDVSLNILWKPPTVQETSLESMDIETAPIFQPVVEPVRRMRENNMTPPKRFFRTFWRSASKRILALSSAQKSWIQ